LIQKLQDTSQVLENTYNKEMKNLINFPYKVMAITLVGSAIILAIVFMVGIPFQIISLFQ
jgi:hypothetical protein